MLVILLNAKRLEWVFITGATRGIGRSTAEYLSKRGYSVIATGRNVDALKELQKLANKNGWNLHAMKMDVTNGNDIAEASQKTFELTKGEGIDVLVNNAGYGQPGFLLDLSPKILKKQFDVNVFGLLEVTKSLAPQLLLKRGRKVINISSVLGKVPIPWMGIYSASKFAVEAISEVLRYELHPFGVKVIIIEPGAIATSFQKETIGLMKIINRETSPYAPVYQWLEETRYKSLYALPSGSPTAVAKIIHKVIKKKNPKHRYVVPLQARIFLALNRILPKWLVDYITRRTFHLHEPLSPPRQQDQKNTNEDEIDKN